MLIYRWSRILYLYIICCTMLSLHLMYTVEISNLTLFCNIDSIGWNHWKFEQFQSLSLSLSLSISLSPSFCVCLEAFGQWTFPFVGKKFMQMVWYGVQLYGNVVALLPLFCSLLFWTHTQFLTNSTLLCTSPPPFLSAIFASHQTFISSFSLIHMSWDLYLLSHYIYFTSIHLYITSPKKLRNSEYIIKNKGWGYILLYWNILVLEIQVQKQKIKVQHNKIKHKRSRNSA